MKRRLSTVLPQPDGPSTAVAFACRDPASHQLVELRDSAGDTRVGIVGSGFGHDRLEAGEHLKAAGVMRKECLPARWSAPRIFTTRSQRRSTGSWAS